MSVKQIEALAERIARLPKNVDDQVFFSQMAKLQDEKKTVEHQLGQFSNRRQCEDVIEYENFVRFTAHLKEIVDQADTSPEIQTATIHKFVHRIEVSPTGFEIEFFVGKMKIIRARVRTS